MTKTTHPGAGHKALAPLIEAWNSPDVEQWRSPFIKTGVAGLPRNAVSGHIYRGSNVIFLLLWQMKTGNRPVMMTFAQKNDLSKQLGTDLMLKSGSKAVHLVRPYEAVPKAFKKQDNGKYKTPEGVELDESKATRLFMRDFAAFSADQLTEPEAVMGLPHILTDREPALAKEWVDKIVSLCSIEVSVTEAQAHFVPSFDRIGLPDRATVTSDEEWIATAFHELVHWTGHASRLERIGKDVFAGEQYAREELVAEIGAALLCARFGIEHVSNAMAYIKSWAKAIEEREGAFFNACADAQKAVDYLEHIGGAFAVSPLEVAA